MIRGLSFTLQEGSNAKVFALIWQVLHGERISWYFHNAVSDSDIFLFPQGLCKGKEASKIWNNNQDISVFMGTFWGIRSKETLSTKELPLNYSQYIANDHIQMVICCTDFDEIEIYMKNTSLLSQLMNAIISSNIKYSRIEYLTDENDGRIGF